MNDTVTTWARASIGPDLRAFIKARERFLTRATSKRLHRLRAAARRLRSTLEDLADRIASDPERATLADLGKILGKARDFHVHRKLLASVLPSVTDERRKAKAFLKRLRRRERRFLERALKALRTAPLLEIP
jgi:CHAD domain-containing protein